MKKITGFLLAASLLTLAAGCSKESTKSTASSKESSEQQVTKASESAESSQAEKIESSSSSETSEESKSEVKEEAPIVPATWNLEKFQQLATFMRSWGTSVKQNCMQLSPQFAGVYDGLQLPQLIINGNLQISVDGVPVDSDWSPTEYIAAGTPTYVIVDAFGDINEENPGHDKHLYLFAITDNKPVVLELASTEVVNKRVQLKTSSITELQNEFTKIVQEG
ncbi:DUF4767 domain-containing protein [Streptococcaceae bacterium ESL0687]|nr:DUF4767 domain-containing protein [Streptococcaceae bacterium ESL0687]